MDGEDWTERHRLAATLPAAMGEAGLLADPEPVRDREGRYWSARWTRDREGGAYGELRVYGVDYVCAIWHDAEPGREVDTTGSRIFRTAEEAVRFLALAFVLGMPAQALLVPFKERQEGGKKARRPNGPRPAGKPILDGLDIGPGFFGEGNK